MDLAVSRASRREGVQGVYPHEHLFVANAITHERTFVTQMKYISISSNTRSIHRVAIGATTTTSERPFVAPATSGERVYP